MRKVIGAIILVAVIAALTSCGGTAAQEPAPLPGTGNWGPSAPDFTVTLFTGEELALSDLRGRPVVLNFWASWCVSCRAEAPTLEKVWRVYKDRGVMFLGLDIQDTEADARAFMEEFNITYPNGPDVTGLITVAYKVLELPTTYFISEEGRIVADWSGPITERALAEHIERLLQ